MDKTDHNDTGLGLLGLEPRQGSLLLQYAFIGSGRVPSAPLDMCQAAASIVEEVIDAAKRSGNLDAAASAPTLAPSGSSINSVFEWLDAICAAAGFETVEEIFHRPKPTHLQ